MSGLSKQHFKAVAEVIKKRHSETTDTACMYGMELIADDLADYFQTQNPKFDKSRFMEACFGE